MDKKAFIKLFILVFLANLLIVITLSAQTTTPPLVFNVENRGASSCTKLTVANKANTKLPDPFEWANGSGRVSTCDEWSCRRNEIKAEVEYYEIGPKPAKPANITATYSGGTLTVKVTINSKTLTLTSSVSVPSGSGPHPVVIGMGSGTGTLNTSFSGVCQVAFMYDQVVNLNYNGQKNQSDPFYTIYPELWGKVSNYCAWSWGVSRIIDGLELVKTQLNLDLSRLAVSGCSALGKMALFSGAFDERITLTIAQESGGGGIPAWRISDALLAKNYKCEKIDNTNYSWFLQSMSSQVPTNLPYDHHELIAMIAPRAFIALGNCDYNQWLCDESGVVSCMAAREVWSAMGVADRFGYDLSGGHQHCSASSGQVTSVAAFVDKFLRNKTANTNIAIAPFTPKETLPNWRTWTTPTITCGPVIPPDPTIPSVTITAPTAGSSVGSGASVSINATVTDADNNVSKVEISVDGVKIGEDLTTPYSFTWTATTKGSHTITVKATDATSKTGSATVSIDVKIPQSPYGGTPKPIPGTIQFEEFDEGGQDSAYYDTDAGNSVSGVTYRSTDDVDIENCTDVGTGYNLGYTKAGEWLEYTVDVAAAGKYDLTLRVACNGTGRTLSVAAKGVTIAKNVAIPNTAGWQTWQDVKVAGISLDAGVQVIRVTIGATDYVNLNYMSFAAVQTTTPPVVNITAPAKGSTFTSAQTVTISVSATSTSGTIASVTISDGKTVLSTDATAPYSFDWTGMTVGTHVITVEATDNNGLKTSKSVTITVTTPPVVKTVNLKAGWNLIGCPIDGSTNIASALSSIWTNVLTVKDLSSFYDKSQPAAFNSLTKLDWGKGYYVKVVKACELDWIAK